MLTRIEIDGFKSFRDFSLDLEPFQVIVGANGVGKSNLFDAMQLLARLAEEDLWPAFQASRGEAEELFSLLPGGQTVDEMRFAVELLIEPRVKDERNRSSDLQDTRLRYELTIGREYDEKGLEHLRVRYERLRRILLGEDKWLGRHPEARSHYVHSHRSTPFISTEEKDGNTIIALHQDMRGGRIRRTSAELTERTVLGGLLGRASATEFTHVFAVREEIRRWRFLQLNPEVLRQPNPVRGVATLSENGDNLARTLARIERDDKYVLNDISRDLANLVPGFLNVEVEEDPTRDQYVVYANTQDGCRFSSRTLSDGTLRLLALITLANDPEYRGVLCFEEPENGVHPFRVEQIVELMRSLTTDFTDDDETEWPLRQLLVNTHSPLLMAQLQDKELLFAYVSTRIAPADGGNTGQVTCIVPTSRQASIWLDRQTPIGRHQIEKYLHSADWDAAVNRLVGEAA